MDIENLKARVYMLAGQLEEAKRVYQEAIKEIEATKKEKDEADKKQAELQKPSDATTSN